MFAPSPRRSTGSATSPRRKDNHDAARRYHQESLARYREIDDRWGIARVLADLANVDLHAGDYEVADGSLREALQAFRALGHQRGVARQLEALSWCAGSQSRHEAAVRLAGAAAAIRQRIGAPAKPLEREKVERTLAQARAGIGAEAYGAAWKEGLQRRSIGFSVSRAVRGRDGSRQNLRSSASDRSACAPPRCGWPARRACCACSRITSSSGAR